MMHDHSAQNAGHMTIVWQYVGHQYARHMTSRRQDAGHQGARCQYDDVSNDVNNDVSNDVGRTQDDNTMTPSVTSIVTSAMTQVGRRIVRQKSNGSLTNGRRTNQGRNDSNVVTCNATARDVALAATLLQRCIVVLQGYYNIVLLCCRAATTLRCYVAVLLCCRVVTTLRCYVTTVLQRNCCCCGTVAM